jgi:hypothetical protein
MHAARAGTAGSVELCLQLGADPLARDAAGWAALHHALAAAWRLGAGHAAAADALGMGGGRGGGGAGAAAAAAAPAHWLNRGAGTALRRVALLAAAVDRAVAAGMKGGPEGGDGAAAAAAAAQVAQAQAVRASALTLLQAEPSPAVITSSTAQAAEPTVPSAAEAMNTDRAAGLAPRRLEQAAAAAAGQPPPPSEQWLGRLRALLQPAPGPFWAVRIEPALAAAAASRSGGVAEEAAEQRMYRCVVYQVLIDRTALQQQQQQQQHGEDGAAEQLLSVGRRFAQFRALREQLLGGLSGSAAAAAPRHGHGHGHRARPRHGSRRRRSSTEPSSAGAAAGASSWPYHLWHIIIRTGILVWLRFTILRSDFEIYDFEIGSA